MSGMSSNKERSEEAQRLMSWGFREFDNFKLFTQGQIITKANVWYGQKPEVDLTVAQDVLKTIHLSQTDKVKVTAEFDEPIKAPITAGQEIGKLKISVNNQEPLEIPLVAAEDVAKVGLLGRFWANVKYFIFGAK